MTSAAMVTVDGGSREVNKTTANEAQLAPMLTSRLININ